MSNAVSERNLISVLLRLLQESELDTATDLYEARGRAVAEKLVEKLQTAEGALEPGVKMFERARDFARAARLREHAKQWKEAAALWEAASELPAAARCWKAAGERERAAAALQASGQHDEAAEIYGHLRQPARQATALARKERWLESAAAFREAGNTRAELDALRAVPLEAKERVPAVKRMVELLVARNRAQEAAQLAAEVLRDNDAGRLDVELHEVLAGLFERLGQGEHAKRLRVRAERLRAREAEATTDEHAPVAPVAEPAPESAPEPEPVAVEQDYRFLKQVPIFARLSQDDMRDLYRLMTEETWTPGKHIIDANKEAPGLVVLLEGDAEVYAIAKFGGARHLNSVGPGSHLGEISLLTQSKTSARVTATTLVRGLRLSREAFEQFLDTHSMAALRVYRLFGEQLAERVRALSAV